MQTENDVIIRSNLHTFVIFQEMFYFCVSILGYFLPVNINNPSMQNIKALLHCAFLACVWYENARGFALITLQIMMMEF